MEYRPLVVHLREVHGVEGLEHMILDRDQKRCMYCPVCDMMLFSQEELVEHCRNDHDDELCVVETKTFSNIKECQVRLLRSVEVCLSRKRTEIVAERGGRLFAVR